MIVSPIARSLVSLSSLPYSSSLGGFPAKLADAVDRLIRADLQNIRAVYFDWLIAATIAVVAGVVLEEADILPAGRPRLDASRGMFIPRYRRIDWIRRITRLGWFLIVLGVAGEGVFEMLTSRVDGILDTFNNIQLVTAQKEAEAATERAFLADKDAGEASKAASDAKAAQQGVEIKLAKQRQATAAAERSLIELQQTVRWRHLTDKQSADFVAALKAFPNGEVKFGTTVGGADEAMSLAKQLLPLFKQAGWKAPEDASGMVQHGDLLVTGIGIVIWPTSVSPSSEKGFERFFMTPLLTTLKGAFEAAGQQVTFVKSPYKTSDVEVVVGSKPEPKQ
jgi:putative heme iron utilization protein